MPLDPEAMRRMQFQRKNGVPEQTYGQQSWMEREWTGYKPPGPAQPPSQQKQGWREQLTFDTKNKNKGINDYQSWRNTQIEQGYTFKPRWEDARNFQMLPKPYPKSGWERGEDGRYTGEMQYYEEIGNKLNTEELPKGAVGWTPDGRPYYGGKSEYQEWQLQYQANMALNETTSSEEASFSDWDAPNIKEMYNEGGLLAAGGALLGGLVEGAEQVNEWVDHQLGGQPEKDAEASASLQTYRKVVYGIKSPLMYLTFLPGEIPKLIGGVMNAGHFLEGRPTVDEYDAIEAKRLKDADDPNWYSKSVHMAHQEPSWANVKAEFWEGFTNSEWLISAMWSNLKGDPTKVDIGNPFSPTGTGAIQIEQMEREIKEDPSLNPYLLSSKYENPWAELIGEVVLDPLNLVGKVAKALMKGVRVANTFKRWGKYGDEMMEIVDATKSGGKIGSLAEGASDAAKTVKFVEQRGKQLRRVKEGIEELAKDKAIWQYTNGAKAHELAVEVDVVKDWIAVASKGEYDVDPEKFFEIVDMIQQTTSKNADEAMNAWAELTKIEGWDVLLTDPGARASLIFDDLAQSGGKIKGMLDAENMEDFWTLADDFVAGQTKKYFPTLAEQIAKDPTALGPGWKALSGFHEMTRPAYNMINGIFSLGYLGLSPGYAARNFLQNTFQAVLDEGFSAANFAKFGSEELVMRWAGASDLAKTIPGMKASMGAAKDIAGKNGKGLINWLAKKAPATKAAAAMEDMAGVKIYAKVYPETMKKILGARDVPAELIKRGIPEGQATEIYETLMKHHGDVGAAMDDILEAAKVGYTKVLDTDLGLTKNMGKFLDETKLRQPYYEIIRTSTTKASAKQAFNDLFEEFLGWAEKGVLTPQTTTVDDATGFAKTFSKLAENKDVPRDVIRNLADHVNVNTDSHQEWRNVLQNITDGWTDLLYENTGLSKPQANKLMDGWLKKVVFPVGDKNMSAKAGLLQGRMGEYSKKLHDEVFDTWDNLRDDAVAAAKKKDHKKLKEIYDNAGLAKVYGEYDPKQTNVVDKLWRGYETEARSLWAVFRDDQSGKVVQSLDQIKTMVEKKIKRELPDYGQQTVKARKMLDRAQKFDGFLHKNAIRSALRRAKNRGDMVGALAEWAKQYRVNLTGMQGGTHSNLYEFIGTMDNIADWKVEKVDDLIAKMFKLDKDAAVDLNGAYYARKAASDVNLEDLRKAPGNEQLVKAIEDAEGKLARTRKPHTREKAQKVLDDLNAKLEGEIETAQKASQVEVDKADEALAKAVERAKRSAQAIEDKVMEETGAIPYAKNEKLLSILNSQLNREFTSIDQLTKEAITWKQAEGAILAHALGERLNLYSDPERGFGMVRRFMSEAADTFTDAQLSEVDEMLYALQLENPKLMGEIRQLKLEWTNANKMLDGGLDDVARTGKMEDIDELAKQLNDKIDVWESAFKEREPEELARLVQHQTTELTERTGEFTTWAGQNAPSEQRAIWEQKDDLTRMAEEMAENIDAKFDQRKAFTASKKDLEKIQASAKWMGDEVAFARRISGEVARATRNFVLHDYEAKRNFDLVLGYLMPYSFWYSRTYAKWGARIPTQPGTMRAYASYKKTLGELHHDMPEWWKYNLNLNELMGIDSESPYFFNLMATLNPLNGVTGLDFNDPDKRRGWFSSAIDSIGKFGPSVYTPITLGLGYYYYMQGEKELGQKWAGRLIPQSQGIKAMTALAGVNEGRGLEIDPNVLTMGGGLDLWERKRVGRALGWAIENQQISEEEGLEAARTQEGEIWDNAVAMAQSKRSWGNVTSLFAGVGFKARTIEDVQIDKMDAEYSRFIDIRDDLSPEEVAKGYDYFRAKYPFFDTVKLSRRDSDERDGSYAYNVLGRIPPGMSNDVYKRVGITYEMTKEFYEEKGIPEGWKDSTKAKFIEAMVEIGAVMAMPDEATKDEWRQVSKLDKQMYKFLEEKYGEHIRDAESKYWDIYSEDGYKKANEWIQSNPDLQEYMNEKTSIRLRDPMMARYYASYDKARSLLWSRRELKLNQEFPGIQTLVDQYYEVNLGSKKEGKAFLEANPQIEKYWDAKGISEQSMNETLLSYASWLPEGEEVAQPQFRQDETAVAERTEEQEDLMDQVMQEGGHPEMLRWNYQQWLGVMNPTLQRMVNDWVQGDEMLSRNAENALEYALQDAGIDMSLEMSKLLMFRAGRGYGFTEEQGGTR